MSSLTQRVVDSLAASHAEYLARLAAGTQPLPPAELTRVLPFLDYTNTQALVAVNVGYLVRTAPLLSFCLSRRGCLMPPSSLTPPGAARCASR